MTGSFMHAQSNLNATNKLIKIMGEHEEHTSNIVLPQLLIDSLPSVQFNRGLKRLQAQYVLRHSSFAIVASQTDQSA